MADAARQQLVLLFISLIVSFISLYLAQSDLAKNPVCRKV
jgi:hypothetical protein